MNAAPAPRHESEDFVASRMAPIVATLPGTKSRRRFEILTAWEPPPGWEEGSCFETLGLYPALRPGLLLRELGEDLVIHDPLSDDIHSLNRPAATVLLLASGARTLPEIASIYARRFAFARDTAKVDVRNTVADLVEKRVLVLRSERTL